ncbi:MAG TPA: PDZ domain-containing protein [Gaiellaceae bacterium]
MARLFKLLLVSGLVLAVVALGLYIIPSDQYIFLPDKARALAPYVNVQGEKSDQNGGGIYYVAVEVKKASLLEKLFHGLHEGSTLVPAAAVRAPGESDRQHQQLELRAMAESQKIGAAVALRSLGYRVPVKVEGTVVAQVASDGPSAGKLQPGDAIVAVDGKPAKTDVQIRRAIRKHRPGETVELSIRRNGGLKKVEVKTVPQPKHPEIPIIGVYLQALTHISLPVPVHINLGQVGGPSAGLAFALDVVEELGHDIDHGHKVAASGELLLNGTVEPVGGLKQKTIGAKEAGAKVFLVPAGENAQEARRYAGDMRIIPVHSFRQALRALATLR